MQIFFGFLCQQTSKNKIISEKFELGGDRNEMEHTIFEIRSAESFMKKLFCFLMKDLMLTLC
jgi:hypothetical protein